jgi:hypothetical protein
MLLLMAWMAWSQTPQALFALHHELVEGPAALRSRPSAQRLTMQVLKMENGIWYSACHLISSSPYLLIFTSSHHHTFSLSPKGMINRHD